MTKSRKRTVQAVILAGGKGTRLRPLTLATPKPVVPIANRPFLTYQLEMLRRAGIGDIVLSLSYRPGDVRKVMKGASPRGVNLRYVVEETPLGTGGAVRFAARKREGTFVVLNGDVLTDVDLRAVLAHHRRTRAMATIVLTRVEDPTVYGVVETDCNGKIRGFLEKPSWEEVKADTVNAGIYVIEEELLRYLPPRPCSIEREFFPELVRQQERFFGYTHEGYWLDIGTSDKYLQAHRDLLGGLRKVFTGYRRKDGVLWTAPGVRLRSRPHISGRAMIGPKSLLGDSVHLAGTVVLGEGCRIGDQVSLDDCVLWGGVEVGEGSRLRGCVLGRGVKVGAHSHLSGHAVLGEECVLPDYSRLAGGDSGKPPFMKAPSEKEAVIGLDLGGTNLRMAGVTRRGEVISLRREGTNASTGPRDLVRRITAGLADLEKELGDAGWRVLGASLGVPGVVSRRQGLVASSPNLPGWTNIPLIEMVGEKVGLHLLLENDANAAVWGEYWAGAGRGLRTIVLLTLGTGVGGGIITDGRLVRGADGMAGEIGHLTVEREGEECPCGNRGCLERYTSATGITRRYRELSGAGGGEEASPAGRQSGVTAAELHALALKGDALALKVFSEAGTYLGIALASLVNIVNPEAIVIGGGVQPAWDFFMPAARREMLCRSFQAPAERVDLMPAALGDEAGLIGAAGLMWRELREKAS